MENIFAVRLGEVKERFDFLSLEIIHSVNSKYPFIKFEEIIVDLKNGAEIRTYSETGFRYLRVTDITNEGLSESSPRFVNVEKIPEKVKLSKNDLLLSRSGSLGIVMASNEILSKNTILSSHIFKISLDNTKVINKYLEVYFRSDFGQKLIFSKNNGGVVPELNQDAVKSLQIPLPPIPTQQKLVEMMDEAYQIKKTKEQKAKELLDSIDDFVMVELGIEKVESVEKKVFGVRLSALKERIDPEFVLKQTIISKSKFKFVELETLAKVEWGNTNITKASYTENGYLAYSATGQDGFLPFHDFDTKAIILSAIGARCGKCFLAKGKWSAIKNTIVIIPKSQEVSIDFLYTYLDNENIWEKSGGAQPFITMAGANKLLVPLPPLEIQQKIADEVEKRRSQAFELQAEARQVLELAKAEFEGEVLG